MIPKLASMEIAVVWRTLIFRSPVDIFIHLHEYLRSTDVLQGTSELDRRELKSASTGHRGLPAVLVSRKFVNPRITTGYNY